MGRNICTGAWCHEWHPHGRALVLDWTKTCEILDLSQSISSPFTTERRVRNMHKERGGEKAYLIANVTHSVENSSALRLETDLQP